MEVAFAGSGSYVASFDPDGITSQRFEMNTSGFVSIDTEAPNLSIGYNGNWYTSYYNSNGISLWEDLGGPYYTSVWASFDWSRLPDDGEWYSIFGPADSAFVQFHDVNRYGGADQVGAITLLVARTSDTPFESTPSIKFGTKFEGNIVGFVPEPATWALMIAGFGLVGAAMRRRQAAFA
ncbi:MAG TPA: PEPxxWA-CTERM sorting domain-containing protein [Sphingomonadaceae bacterium]|nr:PEPxxWA-CTERM sorting domain-containing protein [Sphingomonadaceae bacterium]